MNAPVSLPPPLVAKLLHPTLGVLRGIGGDDDSKLLNIRVGELREIHTALVELNRECERAWRAYRIAHEQAMANGSALAELRAAQGIAARSDETPQEVQPEGQEPGREAMRPDTTSSDQVSQ